MLIILINYHLTSPSYVIPEKYLRDYAFRKDPRKNPEYQEVYYRQKALRKIQNDANSQQLNQIYSYSASDHAWQELGSPYQLLSQIFYNTRFISLALAITLYAMTHVADRVILGRAYTSFIRFLEQGRFGLGGSARFAGLFEEWALLFKKQKQGLFMGRSLYNPFLNIGLEDSRHMMTIAGSRAGKGANVIIPNLLLWKGSALVIDPKGTNALVTAQRRRDMGHDVHIVDPFNVLKDEETACFNPLAMLDPKSPNIREYINIIADALVVPDPGAREKHWDEGAKTIIAGLIGHLVSFPIYDKPTLPMIRDMISQNAGRPATIMG